MQWSEREAACVDVLVLYDFLLLLGTIKLFQRSNNILMISTSFCHYRYPYYVFARLTLRGDIQNAASDESHVRWPSTTNPQSVHSSTTIGPFKRRDYTRYVAMH
jgi:hypothetical protein